MLTQISRTALQASPGTEAYRIHLNMVGLGRRRRWPRRFLAKISIKIPRRAYVSQMSWTLILSRNKSNTISRTPRAPKRINSNFSYLLRCSRTLEGPKYITLSPKIRTWTPKVAGPMVTSILTLHFSSSMLQKHQDTLDQIHLNCLQRGHIWTHRPKTCLLSEGGSRPVRSESRFYWLTLTYDVNRKKIITEGHFKLWKAWVPL